MLLYKGEVKLVETNEGSGEQCVCYATIHYNVTKASDQLGLRHEWSKAAPDEP